MKLFKSKLVDVKVEQQWSTQWAGLKYCVRATYKKSFLGFSWNESTAIAGPFYNKAKAKAVAKRLKRVGDLER